MSGMENNPIWPLVKLAGGVLALKTGAEIAQNTEQIAQNIQRIATTLEETLRAAEQQRNTFDEPSWPSATEELAALQLATIVDQIPDAEMLPKCCELMWQEKRASGLLFMRRLHVSEKRANDLLETFEAIGLLGPGSPRAPREFLVRIDQFNFAAEYAKFNMEQLLRDQIARLESELAEKRAQLSEYLQQKDGPLAATDPEELEEIQRTLIDTMGQFGIQVSPGDITKGPIITRYEFYPAKGVRMDQIVSLERDLARAIRAERINILAPIPGKDTVGIELPNDAKSK